MSFGVSAARGALLLPFSSAQYLYPSRHAVPACVQSIRNAVRIRPVGMLHRIVDDQFDPMAPRGQMDRSEAERRAKTLIAALFLSVDLYRDTPLRKLDKKIIFPFGRYLEIAQILSLPGVMRAGLRQKGHMEVLCISAFVFFSFVPEGVMKAADPVGAA